MTDAPMELDLVVGSLISTRPEEDLLSFEEQREVATQIQDLLRERGVVVDLLAQPGVEVWEGGIETLGALYQLSRLAARLEREAEIDLVLEDGPNIYEDDLDRFVTDIWDELVPSRFAHLINLQGTGSHYLPVDFERPIWLPAEVEGEEEEAYFGSAVALQRELVELEQMLLAAGVSVHLQAFKCLEAMRAGADQSLHYGLPLIVW